MTTSNQHFPYKTRDPTIWGPHYWFVIHNYAHHYPSRPSKLDREVASTFIKNLPFMLPCDECSKHSLAYIKSQINNMDDIVNDRTNLITFFRTFHQEVQHRVMRKKSKNEKERHLEKTGTKITRE